MPGLSRQLLSKLLPLSILPLVGCLTASPPPAPFENPDAGSDAAAPKGDAGHDSGAVDAGATEAAAPRVDAGTDAQTDAQTDATMPPVDAGLDAPVDTGTDASDAGVDAFDAGPPLVCGDGSVLCADACVNEQTDNANCGACGLVCTTGCTLGECIVVLASGRQNPFNLTTFTDQAYWEEPNGDFDAVFGVNTDGGAVASVALNQDGVNGLTATPTGPYWSTYLPGNSEYFLIRGATDGGSPSTLASFTNYPDTVAFTTSAAYFGDDLADGSVDEILLGADAAEPFATGQYFPRQVTTNGATVYWLDGNENVVGAPTDGGPWSIVIAGDASAPSSTNLVATSSNLFWLQSGFLVRAELNGANPVTLANIAGGRSFVVDSTSVYWATGPILGAAFGTKHRGAARQAGPLAADGGEVDASSDSGVDATLGDAAQNGADGGVDTDAAPPLGDAGVPTGVMRVAIDGGTPRLIVSTSTIPASIAVGSESIFWTISFDPSLDGGTVMKATPR